MKAMKLNFASVIIAAIAAFIISASYYIIFENLLMELHGVDLSSASKENIPLGIMLGEFIRSLILTFVLAWFVSALEINRWEKALKLCLLIWIGFPLVLLSGSVMHESIPWKIAAIHAGDWFIKPLVILLILSFKNRINKLNNNETSANSNIAS